jgi:hypothetical protein
MVKVEMVDRADQKKIKRMVEIVAAVIVLTAMSTMVVIALGTTLVLMDRFRNRRGHK